MREEPADRRQREPGKVRAGAEDTGEHGSGAVRLSAKTSGRNGERPSQRGSVKALRKAAGREAAVKQGGNAVRSGHPWQEAGGAFYYPSARIKTTGRQKLTIF